MTSSVSSLTDLSVNNSSANSPSGTPAPSPFLGFDGFKFEPDDADFLSVRGGQQSRSLSFPRIHFGDDEDDEDDDEEDSSDADSIASGSQSDGTRAADDSTTEEERSRSARLKVQRRKSSDRNGRLLRKVVGQREREESTDLENSGLSAIGWGSRVLYIQMVRLSARAPPQSPSPPGHADEMRAFLRSRSTSRTRRSRRRSAAACRRTRAGGCSGRRSRPSCTWPRSGSCTAT